MAESVVSSAARYLGGLLIQEAELLSGVTNQIVKIQSEMTRMQCFLKDADARQDESALLRNWVSEIRDLAYDVEDAIDTYILKAKYANSFNLKKYIRLHQIGKEIETLQSKIQGITGSVETYGFMPTRQGEETSSTTELRQQLRQSYPHYDDEDVIGMEDSLKSLVADLINKKGPHLVSIAGMAGLGKTTLAKKSYNHGDVKRHFDCCGWGFISQQFQVRTILQEIIRKVGKPKEVRGFKGLTDRQLIERLQEIQEDKLETLTVGELNEKLYKLLEDKCYLVVLDDIWSTDAWDVLKHAFPKGKMGSKIMLTTRKKKVALYADPLGSVYEPVYLTEEQSLELFYKKAFLGKNVASISSSSSYPPEVEAEKKELARDMIKKCGGLPLAVVVLGGLMATKQSIREWEMVAKDIGRHLNRPQQNQEEHSVSWILSLSYHDLPSYLKPCFLYLSLYPEDTEFHKRELIHMWIAEGFVQLDGQGMTKEEMGEEYLLELINRSMVHVVERSFRGKVKRCRLHDLMRDVSLQKANTENFLCIFYGGRSTEDSSSSSTSVVESFSNGRMHRHAIHFTCDRYVSMQQLPTRSPHLRAFSLWKPSKIDESIVQLNFVCKKFNFLRVLVLEGINIGSLPRAIGKLIHLRYLRLIAVDEIEVPQSIGNLQSLQFLTLEGIHRLPNVLWKMEQLTYCRVRSGCAKINNKPFRVDGLKNLSTLECWVPWRKKLQLGNGLPTLKNLRQLFLFDINGDDLKSLHRFSIYRLDRLQCLRLKFWCPISDEYDWSPLSCCHRLWKLCVEGWLKKLPELKEFPPNLTKLWLRTGELEDPIPTLEMLQNLNTLRITDLFGTLPYEATTKYCFSAKGFGRLQYLQLRGLRLEELEVEKGALPCLVHLQIRNCQHLRMLPEGLVFITTLKKLELINMPDEFNRRLGKEGEDWHKIQHIPSIIIWSYT